MEKYEKNRMKRDPNTKFKDDWSWAKNSLLEEQMGPQFFHPNEMDFDKFCNEHGIDTESENVENLKDILKDDPMAYPSESEEYGSEQLEMMKSTD